MTNMDPNLVSLWNELPSPKILVYPWEATYQPAGAETAQRIKTAIAQQFAIPEPEVGPPYAAIKPTRRFSAPWCFVVTDLPSFVVDKLIQQQFWPTPSIVFFAIPFAPPAYEYICAIENFTFKDLSAFADTIGSITVKPLNLSVTGGGTKLLWNVYTTPPSKVMSKNQEWRRIVRSLPFLTPLNGVGVVLSQPMSCVGCKSIDHPRGLCPFPQISDWATKIPPPNLNPPTTVVFETPRGCGARGLRRRGETRGRSWASGRAG
jgi:hypothetical protein